MHGYGGYTWMASRQLNVLKNHGYKIIALDFILVLRKHDPQDLIDLMNEVDSFCLEEGLISPDILVVGISLGGLVGYNLMRRHEEVKRLLIITGGNIALLPTNRSLAKKWNITRQELEDKWQDVNMYSTPGSYQDRHIIMLLPKRDKLIDPNQVLDEIDLHRPYNNIKLIDTNGGHFRTIITETILRPNQPLKLIHELEKPDPVRLA